MKYFVSAMFAVLVWVGAASHAQTPQGRGCVVYVPHADVATTADWSAWTNELESYSNLDYSNGEWRADGKVVGYSTAEDAPITNGEC